MWWMMGASAALGPISPEPDISSLCSYCRFRETYEGLCSRSFSNSRPWGKFAVSWDFRRSKPQSEFASFCFIAPPSYRSDFLLSFLSSASHQCGSLASRLTGLDWCQQATATFTVADARTSVATPFRMSNNRNLPHKRWSELGAHGPRRHARHSIQPQPFKSMRCGTLPTKNGRTGAASILSKTGF